MNNKITFYSLSNLPRPFRSSSFDKVRHQYAFTYDETGRRVLEVKRDINIQDEIQSFEQDCNIYNIINRYLYGDVNALNQVNGSYIDMVGAPKNLHEALNLSNRLKNDFYNLKPEVRAEFNNDFGQYVASISNGKAFEVFKKFNVNTSADSVNDLNNALDDLKKRQKEAEINE